MSQEAAEEIAWFLSHLRVLVATAPTAWARQKLTLPQLTALQFIHAAGFLTLTALARALGTRPPATSAMVDRLTDAGLVQRAPDPAHGARVRVQVTAEAARLLGDIDTRTARHFQVVLQALTPEQQQGVAAHLKDLVWHSLLTSADQGRTRRTRRTR